MISKRRLRSCGKPRTRGDIAMFAVEVGRKAAASVNIEPQESPATVLDLDLGHTPQPRGKAGRILVSEVLLPRPSSGFGLVSPSASLSAVCSRDAHVLAHMFIVVQPQLLGSFNLNPVHNTLTLFPSFLVFPSLSLRFVRLKTQDIFVKA